MNKIFVSGLLNIETTLKVDSFPIAYSPIEYPFYGLNTSISGVGYNIAKALTTLGENISLFSVIGEDGHGFLIKDVLKKEGIKTNNIIISDSTAESVVIYDKNGMRKIYCDLKNLQDINPFEHPEDYIPKVDDYAIAVITNINFNRPLLPFFKNNHVTIATDVHILGDVNEAYSQEFMEYADILFLSNEAIKEKESEFARELYNKFHNKIIVIGCGEEGALAYLGDSDTFIYEKAVAPLGIVNTVGAGDALFSSFIHFYNKGYDVESCLKHAVVFAGLKISTSGGAKGFFNEETLKKYL